MPAFLETVTGSAVSLLDSDIISEIGTLLTSFMGWITSNSLFKLYFTIGLVGFIAALFGIIKAKVRN